MHAHVADNDPVTRLEERLDDMLGEQPDGRIAVAVPSDHWDDYAAAQAFATKVNRSEAYLTDDFSLEYVFNRARVQRPGTRFAALRDGTVTPYSHTRAAKDDAIWTSHVLRWTEAEVTLGARRFFLLDGQWYEIGEACLEAIRSQVERLITGPPSVDLPALVQTA